MNITLHIEAENPEQLQQAIKGLADNAGTAVNIAPSNDGRTRKAKSKAKEAQEPTLDLKEEPAETPEPPKIDDPEVPLDEPVPTVVELRALAAEKGQADATNKPKIHALLDSYECKSISTVPEDKRLAFKADLEAL